MISGSIKSNMHSCHKLEIPVYSAQLIDDSCESLYKGIVCILLMRVFRGPQATASLTRILGCWCLNASAFAKIVSYILLQTSTRVISCLYVANS